MPLKQGTLNTAQFPEGLPAPSLPRPSLPRLPSDALRPPLQSSPWYLQALLPRSVGPCLASPHHGWISCFLGLQAPPCVGNRGSEFLPQGLLSWEADTCPCPGSLGSLPQFSPQCQTSTSGAAGQTSVSSTCGGWNSHTHPPRWEADN